MAKPKTTANEGDKTKWFSLPSSEEEDAPVKTQKPVEEYVSSNDDPLVSGYSKPVAVRGEVESSLLRVESRIGRLWVYTLPYKPIPSLGMQLHKLKAPVAFQQLDGSRVCGTDGQGTRL